jgi:hypothetical protein
MTTTLILLLLVAIAYWATTRGRSGAAGRDQPVLSAHELDVLADRVAGSIDAFVHAPEHVREAVPRAVRESGLESEWIRTLTIACYGLAMGFVAAALTKPEAAHVIRSLQARLRLEAAGAAEDLESFTAAVNAAADTPRLATRAAGWWIARRLADAPGASDEICGIVQSDAWPHAMGDVLLEHAPAWFGGELEILEAG